MTDTQQSIENKPDMQPTTEVSIQLPELSGNGDDGDQQDQQHQQQQQGQDLNETTNSFGEPLGQGRTRNSYKYPMLNKYFEFGPWVGKNRKTMCRGCRTQTSSSQPDRLLRHLQKCIALSESEKAEISILMNDRTANKRKKTLGMRSGSGYDDCGYGDDDACSGDDVAIIAPNSKRIKRDPSDRNGQIDEALTRFIVICKVPLKAIHSREFIELIRTLNNDYHIPSRETITNNLIPGLLNII